MKYNSCFFPPSVVTASSSVRREAKAEERQKGPGSASQGPPVHLWKACVSAHDQKSLLQLFPPWWIIPSLYNWPLLQVSLTWAGDYVESQRYNEWAPQTQSRMEGSTGQENMTICTVLWPYVQQAPKEGEESEEIPQGTHKQTASWEWARRELCWPSLSWFCGHSVDSVCTRTPGPLAFR